MIVEVKTRSLDGVEVSRVERRLYSLRELKDEKHIEGEDIVEYKRSTAFENACENIGRMMDESGWTQTDIEMEIDNYLLPEVLGKAGITTNDGAKSISWDVSYVQGGMFFSLDPAHTSIDARLFMRAMQAWFLGRDWRGPEYAASTQQPRFPTEAQRKVIDLRRGDAWHAVRGNLFMQVERHSVWSSGFEIDPGYDYEHEFSDEFMRDCNDFLEEILRFCLHTIRAEVEDRGNEESMLDLAEANEWTFTNEGAWA